MVRSFGIPQDEATRTNGPAAAQDIATNTFSGVSATFNYSFPPLSMTLLTLQPPAPTLAVVSPAGLGQFVIQLQGQPGARYSIQSSTNLSTWTWVSTNALVSGLLNITNPVTAGAGYFRAVWQP